MLFIVDILMILASFLEWKFIARTTPFTSLKVGKVLTYSNASK